MPDPCAVVIFGASGDLTKRKLFPALHNLQAEKLIPDKTSIVGTSRTKYSSEEFDHAMRKAVEAHSRLKPTDQSWETFHKDLVYVPGDINDDNLFNRLKK